MEDHGVSFRDLAVQGRWAEYLELARRELTGPASTTG